MRAWLIIICSALLLSACYSQPAYGPPDGPSPFPPHNTPVNGQMCGGMMGARCNVAGEFCYMPISAQCGAADQTGVCRPIPEMCTQNYAPVCGCDGRTYSNECMANGQGVSAAYQGVCQN